MSAEQLLTVARAAIGVDASGARIRRGRLNDPFLPCFGPSLAGQPVLVLDWQSPLELPLDPERSIRAHNPIAVFDEQSGALLAFRAVDPDAAASGYPPPPAAEATNQMARSGGEVWTRPLVTVDACSLVSALRSVDQQFGSLEHSREIWAYPVLAEDQMHRHPYRMWSIELRGAVHPVMRGGSRESAMVSHLRHLVQVDDCGWWSSTTTPAAVGAASYDDSWRHIWVEDIP